MFRSPSSTLIPGGQANQEQGTGFSVARSLSIHPGLFVTVLAVKAADMKRKSPVIIQFQKQCNAVVGEHGLQLKNTFTGDMLVRLQ